MYAGSTQARVSYESSPNGIGFLSPPNKKDALCLEAPKLWTDNAYVLLFSGVWRGRPLCTSAAGSLCSFGFPRSPFFWQYVYKDFVIFVVVVVIIIIIIIIIIVKVLYQNSSFGDGLA